MSVCHAVRPYYVMSCYYMICRCVMLCNRIWSEEAALEAGSCLRTEGQTCGIKLENGSAIGLKNH